mmetsp:Transcript_19350/g.57502  ORF Transcript_19350/g.57502 Transcript_19350/m.57502 type:complete len:237 (+) Transcript_19350:209-919(+)
MMDKISLQRALGLVAALIAVLVVDDGLGVDALNRPASPKASLGPPAVERRPLAAYLAALLAPAATIPLPAKARPEGVNKPELLPKVAPGAPKPKVIDVGVNFLTKGQQKRLDGLATKVEASSGFKIRVLCQSYPETPGLAIKDFWGVDDKTIVLVADKGLKGTSNILNFNVGDGLEEKLPTVFWSRLQGRFGTSRYWREQGEDVAISNAVEAISYCLLQEDGCVDPPSRELIDAKL